MLKHRRLPRAVDLGGTFNHNLRLNRPGQGDVVLRIYRPWVTAGRLVTLRAIRQRLSEAGLPLPRPLAGDRGELVIPVGERLAELEPFVANDGGTDSWGRAETAAGLLGTLHGALAGWRPPVPVVRPRVHTALPDLTLRRWLARTRAVVGSGPRHHRRREALATIAAAERVLTALGAITLAELPVSLTHGDYGHNNLRFRGETPVALLDLDFAGVRPRVADLADLAFSPHWMPSFGQLGRPPARRDWFRVADLIRSYGAATDRPLARGEIVALPALMARLPVAWAAMGWLMSDPVVSVADLAGEIDTAAWLLANRDDLAGSWQTSGAVPS